MGGLFSNNRGDNQTIVLELIVTIIISLILGKVICYFAHQRNKDN